MTRVAKRLRELRERHGLTQEQAADLTQVGYKYYQSVESGSKKQIWLETVARFAAAYGLGLHEFLDPEMPARSLMRRKPADSAVHYAKRKPKPTGPS